ncbi:MAG TPA: phosphatidylglycerol lysyltransferase domain-containing protein [Acidimicrobiales bacterium]|nr:phosphatidylglycerol lysyltransferase domain-containing protein [Acidimicrobiales bacterium]
METPPAGRARQLARILGIAVEAAGLATIAAALLPEWPGRVRLAENLLTPGVTRVASGAAALTGVSLVLVGRGVAARRRYAWMLAVALLTLATLAHMIRGLDLDATAITAAVAVALVWCRDAFVVAPGRARLRDVARIGAVALAVDVAYGITGLVLRAGHVHPRLTPGLALREVAARLVGFSGPLAIAGRFGRWFPGSLTALGLLTLATMLAALLGPVVLGEHGPETEPAELARLVDRPDGDTLDPFVARRDKRLVFSPDRRAVIGYRYVRGVGLAAGDPVGDPAAFDAAVRALVALCDGHGWRPALIGARGDHVGIYEQAGLRTLYVGDEAIVDVAGFGLAGGRMRNVRKAVNRTMTAGLTTEIHREGDLVPGLRDELLAIAAAQRGAFREFGFSMTLDHLLAGVHDDCLVVVCRDRAGRPTAFQRYVPCRHGGALSLDVMRRRPDAVNGVNERMIVDTIAYARERGISDVSLNFAAFRTMFDEDAELESFAAAQAWFLRRLEGRFGIQMDSLRRFNAKFQPRWVPRHVVYRAVADLPAVGFAALSAEGFLPFDGGREPALTGRRGTA